MALAHPALTTIGKRKSKVKFRNAEHARQHRELEQQWQKNQENWKSMSKVSVTKNSKTVSGPSQPLPPPGRETKKIPSLNQWVTGPVTCGGQKKRYTGTNIIGIATMHKSNMVPVFTQEQAISLSQMRRG